jgi:DNA-binding SARP family transcriptional activator
MPRADPNANARAPDAVEIDLLGGFRVRVDGVDIGPEGWPSRRSAQLVQLLALADGHRLHREQVIEALWPQLDPDAGGANLRKAAHHARQALLCPDAIVLRRDQVVLFPARGVYTDVDRFERLAETALSSRETQACAAAAGAYGGELLPGAPYEEWIETARVRLRARHLELLRAIGHWQGVAELEPTDEHAHAALMRRAMETGNRPAALRWYASAPRSRSSAGSASCRPGNRRRSTTSASPAMRVAGPDVRRPRDLELANATSLLRAEPAQRPGGLAVRGPAGIGKSAFLRRLKAHAREGGWTVVGAEAVESGRPYAVLSAAVEEAMLADPGVLDAIGAPARAVLAAISPLAAPAAALAGPPGRHQVIGAFRRLVLAAAGAGRAMVMIDDAHLLDEASADVLLHLAATGRPVLVVLACRPQSAQQALNRGIARLERSNQLAVIDLPRLEADEATALAERASPGPRDAVLLERIVALSGGIPFAILELARAADAGTAARLPGGTVEAIAARLGDLDEESIALLRRLALASDELDTALVLALTGSDEAKAFALLDKALGAGVLVVAGGRYRFRHDLVRQALVERIPPHQKLAVHRDAARRLAALDAPPAAIARHWLAGERPDEAIPWLLAAAREASRLGAYADALGYLEPLLAREARHAEALRLRAEALDALGDFRALAAYELAADAIGGAPAHDLRAKRALAQVKMGDPKGGLEALEGVAPASVEGRLAEALALSGAAALGFADPAMGTLKAAESRRLALQSGDASALVTASWAQAAAAHARGELHKSVWADLCETSDVHHLAMRVFDGQLCITQRFLYGAKPYAEVIAFADALAAEACRVGATRGHAFAVTLRGEAELLSGQLDAAEDDLEAGRRLHRAIGGATGEAFALQRRAEAAQYRGDVRRASALLEEALDIARQSDIGFHLLDRIYGTRVALALDPQAALAALEDAAEAVRGPLETCPGCRITFAVPAAIAAARAGRLELAERYARDVDYLANVVMRLPAWHAALEEVRGHIAAAQGDRSDATLRFAAASAGFRRAGHPLDAARCAGLATPSRAGG